VAIYLEADRMRSLKITPETLKNQQDVVSEEVRVNDSQQIECEMGSVRLVAFDHVPESASLAIDSEGHWTVSPIPGSAFGVTCTSPRIDLHVSYGTGELHCNLTYDTLKCAGR